MADAAGMYVDWQRNRLVDSRGFYFRDKAQIDAIEFLITIDNTAWPCAMPGSMASAFSCFSSPAA